MKRLFFILLFFGIIALCGCQREKSLLEYQSKNISAECVVNNAYRVRLEKTDDSHRLTVLEPKEAQGISFILGETVTAVCGQWETEMSRKDLKGICAIGGIFSQKEDCLTGAAPQGEGSVLTFCEGECLYSITLGKSSLPRHVRISAKDFEYDIEIVSIELK